ncbi:MAG: ribonuclease Y [Candidatus Kerfeldbacteria bacterium]|nr:ribonuclease Y [Candidatus Kerfeldbacteria bacterium]
MENLIFVVTLAIAAPLGMLLGYYARKVLASREVDSAEARVEQMLAEGRQKQKDLILEAKDKAISMIEQAKLEEEKRRKELDHMQSRVEQRENVFDQKLLDLENKQKEIQDRAKKIDDIKQEILKIKDDQKAKLETVAAMSRDEAKEELLKAVERDEREAIQSRIRKVEQEGTEEYEEKARSLLAAAMQRYVGSHVAETTTTTVTVPSEEMKGRIIGKEGRNIKAIEQLTGVELIVDETPGSIMVSGFSPIRRHLARIALEKLISDGRIHPTRIEETVEIAKKELSSDIKKAGENACYEVGVGGLDPKLMHILGRLKYRTSYGQNVLLHSIEVAHLSRVLAEQLGADVSIAKKGGLLHDIGKAVDHEVQGPHTQIGYDIMKKFGLPEDLAYIAIAHHEDHPRTLEGIIVKVADSISGGRPGARKDSYEQYIQRLEELENVALAFEGVEKAYAIQAGREVRVFVTPERVDDYGMQMLAGNIARKIESELKYPGEIKVNCIRERRIVEYAR